VETESKENLSASPPESEPTPDTKWFTFFQELSEKGGIQCALEGGLQSAARDPELCKGRAAEGTIFYVWQTEAFLMLKMEQKDDTLVEAVSKTLGCQPSRYSLDQKSNTYIAEWEKDPSTQNDRKE